MLVLTAGIFPAYAQDDVQQESAAQISEMPAVQEIYYNPEVPDEVITDRMKCIENEIKLTNNAKTRSFIDYFTIKNRRYLSVMEMRRNIYFPIFEEYLKKHNMPEELKYLSIVESGLNPKAKSWAGAAGLWQFMPSTGKIYNLHQDAYLDERLDPYEATEAACKYLRQLYNIFHDWELALASYNCGPGNVRRAIRKSGYKENFWEIYNYLPQETRGYVPQFVAITYVMNYYNEYQFKRDSVEYAMAFDTILINRPISIEKLANNLNICKDDLLKLNPGLKKEVIPAYLNYVLRVPSDAISTFHANRLAILDSSLYQESEMIAAVEEEAPSTRSVARTQKIYHKVRKGEVLGKIAGKYNVSVSDIKKWNRLKGNTVKVGQQLVIQKKSKVKVTESEPRVVQKTPKKTQPEKEVKETADAKDESTDSDNETASAEEKQEKEKVSAPSRVARTHTVKSGDNLMRIAEKYDVSVADIKKWNSLKGSSIKAGQKLKIYREKSEAVYAQASREQKVYYVQPGDTLWSISRKHNGVSVEEIKKKNNLKSENLKVGMKLIIG
jgi:membrane-bound lytic murein transglycosylase D